MKIQAKLFIVNLLTYLWKQEKEFFYLSFTRLSKSEKCQFGEDWQIIHNCPKSEKNGNSIKYGTICSIIIWFAIFFILKQSVSRDFFCNGQKTICTTGRCGGLLLFLRNNINTCKNVRKMPKWERSYLI